MKIKSQKDFFAGLMFMVMGIALRLGRDQLHHRRRGPHGPRLFPARARRDPGDAGHGVIFEALVVETEDGDKVGSLRLEAAVLHHRRQRAVRCLLGGLPKHWLPALGLIVGIYVLTFVAAKAGDEFNVKEVAILATVSGHPQLPGLHRAAETAVPGLALFPVQLIHREKEPSWNCSAISLWASASPSRLHQPALCFIGCLLGTLIGVLPGIGPVATIAMLLPATYALPPVSALIMLAGIYYGAQYGGSTTAILVNLPGESSSVVTVIDGYQMARQGRAGPRWRRPASGRSSPAASAR
jgi:hypothetical protein